MRLRVFHGVCAAILFAGLAGCRPDSKEPTAPTEDTFQLEAGHRTLPVKLKDYGIVGEHLSLATYSPDSQFLALVVDSTVRFGPGDQMWSEELPSGSYGVRNRNILYLYLPSSDSLAEWAECEEVVNLYEEETSQPLQPRRWERITKLRWSPEGGKLLVAKDRLLEGVRQQEVLIFTPGEAQPAFIDMFKVWQRLMNTYQGARGTRLEEAEWEDSSKIRVILSMLGVSQAPRHEFIFDAATGQIISSRKLPSI